MLHQATSVHIFSIFSLSFWTTFSLSPLRYSFFFPPSFGPVILFSSLLWTIHFLFLSLFDHSFITSLISHYLFVFPPPLDHSFSLLWTFHSLFTLFWTIHLFPLSFGLSFFFHSRLDHSFISSLLWTIILFSLSFGPFIYFLYPLDYHSMLTLFWTIHLFPLSFGLSFFFPLYILAIPSIFLASFIYTFLFTYSLTYVNTFIAESRSHWALRENHRATHGM